MSGRIGRCWMAVLLLLGWQAVAQSPVENLRKYDLFRERLNRDFLYCSGDASLQGSYLPMESRRMAADGTVTAYWADGTWWLGHYVAMLATEQARLKMEGDSAAARQSLAELRQALRVYDRLDCMAEPCWGGDSCTNGFYLRDDLPASMAERFGAGRILSDYAQHCGDRQSLANGPSQDQAWASYLGLALVQALTDDTLLHAHAASIARRLLQSMQDTDAQGKEHWQVTNPVNGDLLQPSGDIQWLRYAHARACEQLTGDSVTFGEAHTLAARQLWSLIQDNFTLDKKGHYNWYGVLALSTVINERGGTGGSTCEWLANRCQELTRLRPDLQQPMLFPHFPLISLLLYPQEPRNMVRKTVYESLLDAAPAEGAFRLLRNGAWVQSQAPWHSLSLFCPWHDTDEGRFNMLDYMLLYNLYRLVYAPEKPSAVGEVASLRVAVFPNPAAEEVQVRLADANGAWCCSLCDLQGRLLQRQTAEGNSLRLDLSAYAPGCYFLQVTAGNRTAAVVKMVKL